MRASEFSGGSKTLGAPADSVDTTADTFASCDHPDGICFAPLLMGFA
jgi:hypothetical protein